MIQPCRGSLVDSMFDEKKKNKRYENRRSCRITTRPGTHNYIVFYSTVETTMANTEENGSWFVRNICTCLNYADDESLLKFFTIVQNRMHQASRIFTTFEKNTPLGQTPELKMFTQDRKFIISKLKIPARAISITDGYGEVSKVRNERFSEYFSWKSDEGRDIRGRRGFILSAVKSTQVQDVKRALRMLDFEITDWKLSRPSMDIYFNMVSKLEPDVGCIMTCIFGPVCKNKHKEVCVRVENGQEIPISNILHSLVGPKNDKLIEKPKILFVVNMEALQTDSFSAVDIEDLQVSATNHSGWLVLILKHEDALKELIEIFENIGENSLQELLEPLLTRESKREDVVLLNSTMQYLIKFPNWIRAFVKPDFKFKKTQNQRGQMDNSENSTRNPLAEKINFDALLKMANRMFEENKNSIESHIWSPHVSSDIESSKELDLVRDSAARDRTDTSILWLFNSVAGAGKSTVLKEMRHQLTNHDGGFKILLIPLKENEWYLLEMPALKVDEIEFLAKTTCNSHDDINNWIKKREVIVFLDGFDEVCPNFREEMINILIALNNARVPLFIGTRPHEVHHIQERIENSMAVEIEPLDEEKQNELKQIVAGGGLRQRTRND
ncbi:uncharacterized protein LOC135943874 [Cloeon dipterum]|uniref:uncharacterized protein LOC135943874 n=1 Tax=Cloeon dipterum TaxID=197152 RepID=UPI00321FDF94